MVASVPSSLPRKLITDHVLTRLRDVSFPDGVGKIPVGDMAAPDVAYGWGTDPDAPATEFTPYLSLTPGPASRITGSLGDSSTEYETNYAVVFAGVSRKQAEALADNLRRFLHALPRLTLDYDNPYDPSAVEQWRVTQYRCTRIGGMQRVRGAFPDYFTEQDDYLIRVSKEK